MVGVGGATGLDPLTPGVQPPLAPPNFSSLPRPFFSLFLFYRVPPPKIQIFAPAHLTPVPTHFSSEATPLPPPLHISEMYCKRKVAVCRRANLFSWV